MRRCGLVRRRVSGERGCSRGVAQCSLARADGGSTRPVAEDARRRGAQVHLHHDVLRARRRLVDRLDAKPVDDRPAGRHSTRTLRLQPQRHGRRLQQQHAADPVRRVDGRRRLTERPICRPARATALRVLKHVKCAANHFRQMIMFIL